MSSKFSVQPPHILASLPRPINHNNGRYVVGEVHGGQPGSKKRKRAELAVGIDGEGVNLYDIASSRLLTSYALPPQSVFTCPPTSTRTKISRTKIDRRTYVSTSSPQYQVNLFCEATDGAASKSKTVTRNVESSRSPIMFLGTIAASRQTDAIANGSDLLAVKEDGSIQCFSGEDLKDKWTSPASALVREDLIPSDIKVEFAQLTNAHSAGQGILKGRQDILSIFPEEVSEDGFNPELLVLITKTLDTRTLRIIAMPRRSAVGVLQQSVESLLTVELPAQEGSPFKEKTSYSLQVSTGHLQQLSGGRLVTLDLTNTLPKITSKLRSTGAQSFLRLSNTSVMVSTDSSITVYNPKYQSVLATVCLDSSTNIDSLKRKRSSETLNGLVSQSCLFVAYFPKLGSAIAISSNNLLAIQVEGQLDRQGRPRATGLLIDSLGCSAKDQFQSNRSKRTKTIIEHELKTLDLSHLNSNNPDIAWADQIAVLEASATKGDATAFDSLLSTKLGLEWPTDIKINGTSNALIATNGEKNISASTVEIRRWVLYVLSKIFSITEEDGKQRLSVSLYPPNAFMWILKQGNMTIANLEIALRQKLVSSGHLVNLLEEIDPDMDLLLILVSGNHLDAAELLHAIKRLMDSLGLFGESALTQALLTNGEGNGHESGDPEAELVRLEAEAENDLAMAEYQLGSGSSVRGQALSVALAKLYICPDNAITYALQTTFTTSETIGLIGLLRYELSRGGWTSRYIDIGESTIIDEDAEVPNHAIVLIASLLNNCIDAIGAGGWLTSEARLVNGDPFEAQELITSIKLEVEAAFEGIEQAKYLSGLISEMVRYGEQVQKGQLRNRSQEEISEKKKSKPSKPKVLPMGEQEKMLPLGLKADHLISFLRVGAGGEIQKRTARDIGHLKSQKVGKYTLERIVV